MSLFKPKYKDARTGLWKHSKIWWYEFIFAGRCVRESTKSRSKIVASDAEKRRRRELEQGFNGLGDRREERIRNVQEVVEEYRVSYGIRHPRSSTFAKYALDHISRLLGGLMLVDLTDRVVINYQNSRLSEGASPKTINEEVGFLLRLPPATQGGAIRAQLKQQKALKLKIDTNVGKAYTVQEKTRLIGEAKRSKRSKAVHMATMLALHAGMRDNEIKTLQWVGLDVHSQIVTVGRSKTDAGTGRTIPMNSDLLAAVREYADWYRDRFGTCNPEWYVFPFGKPRPNDPTRHQTSFKTAWRNARSRANVNGRFHDNRHTFVTDLAEGGASDQVIQELAGHVSIHMVKHYSHIRTEAKRKAVSALVTSPGDAAQAKASA